MITSKLILLGISLISKKASLIFAVKLNLSLNFLAFADLVNMDCFCAPSLRRSSIK